MSLLSSLLGRRLRIGNRVRLYGGYDMEPKWLGGKEAHTGKCVAFIVGQNKQPAAVIALDDPMVFDNTSGPFAVLELRYVGARWSNSEVVHVELCDAMPDNKTRKERKQGLWVESHARYAVV